MDEHSKRPRHSKSNKGSRRPRAIIPLQPIRSGEVPGLFSVQGAHSRGDPSVHDGAGQMKEIIDDLTSEGDDTRDRSSSRFSSASRKLIEPQSPQHNDNHSSLYALRSFRDGFASPDPSPDARSPRPRKSGGKDRRADSFSNKKYSSPSRTNSVTEKSHPTSQKSSIGELRRSRLIECMKYYQKTVNSTQQFQSLRMSEDPIKADKQKKELHAMNVWYQLKRFFRGIDPIEDRRTDPTGMTGINTEKEFVDEQRRYYLNEFYTLFMEFGFERSHPDYHRSPIQRYRLSEHELNYCHEVERALAELFGKWDHILALFPSHSKLMEFDKRFDSCTQEGRMFHEKMSVFQAWFNLNAEINRLIAVLGRIMVCTPCHMWPSGSSMSASKANEEPSRPPTPSSASSNELREATIGPSHQTSLNHQFSSVSTSSSLSGTQEPTKKRQYTMSSTPSVDSVRQPVTFSSPLTDYYSRYIDDQLTHARLELIASIFRSKHGSLLQRLRYMFRKEQANVDRTFAPTQSAPFDAVFNNHLMLPVNIVPDEYLHGAEAHDLMNEFFTLSKQLQQQRNPNLGNADKMRKAATSSDQVTNILSRLDRNPTLTSSTFPPASAPTLVLRIVAQDRSILKRQSYFLDYLDPTLYPHLPGSTLFPDPCTFLHNLPLNSFSQLATDDNAMIGKMLVICNRMYEKHVWTDSRKFSDMFEMCFLPSLYPQYVFLVQIPLDLMLAWQKYHQVRKMEPSSSTGALLLLLDECKILIHGATLVRQYIKLMITEILEPSELQLIAGELKQFDQNIIVTMDEIITCIERYIEMSLRAHSFHHCIDLLKDQWKFLQKYATMMNIEENLAEKFLKMYSSIVQRFREHIDVFRSTPSAEEIKIESVKKRIQRRYQKKLTIDILRETKAMYDDCALTINIYLQKPVCRRFLLILKTARFARIKFVSDEHRTQIHSGKNDDASPSSTCLLFAPAEYFEDNATKLQLARTLSSSFRIHTVDHAPSESPDDPLPPPQQQQSPTQSQQPPIPSVGSTPPLVYILCVPVSNDLESGWSGVTHTISSNKNLTSISPLSTNWKTTTIFLLTQQTTHLDKFEESFKERLSKTNVQQNDLYHFDTKTEKTLQKRSCFEKVDGAMSDLAHSILSLANCVMSDVTRFEHLIDGLNADQSTLRNGQHSDRIDLRTYVHTEERAFGFVMDVIRETSFYANQFELSTLKTQAERQLSFANTWLHFVRRKKATTYSSKDPLTLPMWLKPGIHFLCHICAAKFADQIDDETILKFDQNLRKSLSNKYNTGQVKGVKSSTIRSKRVNRVLSSSSSAAAMPQASDHRKERTVKVSRVQQLRKLDEDIDDQRFSQRLIGQVNPNEDSTKISSISRTMEQDLAHLRIKQFQKMNLLSRGQFATTYKCTVPSKGVCCYKQYKIQHNDAGAISRVLEQLVPLIHIAHENIIKYHGITIEHDHILFFMEYFRHGTIAQLLVGTSPCHANTHRQSSSVVCSIADTPSVDNGVIQATAGFAFLQEYLAQRYVRQLLSALASLHKNEIIHRDLRNVNIFFTDSSKQMIKLGDVNFVYDFKFMQKQSSLIEREDVAQIRESIVFYAPEMTTQNETTTKSDIWALGCTLVHMLTGRVPWSNSSPASTDYYLKVMGWVASGVRPIISNDFVLSEACNDFVKLCFRQDPSERPSSHDLLEHPFVKET